MHGAWTAAIPLGVTPRGSAHLPHLIGLAELRTLTWLAHRQQGGKSRKPGRPERTDPYRDPGPAAIPPEQAAARDKNRFSKANEAQKTKKTRKKIDL